MDVAKQFEIIRIEDGQKKQVHDQIIVEYDLALYVNGEHFVDMLCTPRDLQCLVYGHLFAEGVVRCKEDVQEFTLAEHRADIILRGNVAKEVQALQTNVLLRAEDVFAVVGSFHGQSELFSSTGGVHNCELHHLDGRRIFMEDLGRHNAGDKALGGALLEDWDLTRAYMISSGRVPKYMAQKAINTGISIIISKSPATAQAVELARAHNLTLCGFVRGRRMNIYSGPERILG
ncbi:MAG: formate dehydrogenase accessory sulfurtransferase FdhD [Limnochordia bacterium]|nr:formate dehydrogenase accessory sulfurtransferase FdhD [Limnochordia bacterium]